MTVDDTSQVRRYEAHLVFLMKGIMEYTDTELLNWWVGLTKSDQRYLIETMIEKMERKQFPESLLHQYDAGLVFSPRQLEHIRKWDR